ncbi:MAG: GNAT family N-acetyltransferase [Oscillospiraceae bacterium]|nr:GNAT family N-acetyltransferase [Oscillospiraceae bacterium]
MLTVSILHGADHLEQVMDLRVRVFHDEQGFTEELDGTDAVADHFLVFLDGRPVATGRTFPAPDGSWHLGRIAVVKDCRGAHVGAYLVEQIERFLREKGVRLASLSAQEHAVGFYEKLGYKAQGGFYMDQHCPHKDMVKELA